MCQAPKVNGDRKCVDGTDLAERFAQATSRVLGRPLELERPAPGPAT